MNGLYTSYLGFFNRKDIDFARWDSPDGLRYLHEVDNVDVVFIPFFVMRGRGNDILAPTDYLLRYYKNGKINWSEYRRYYLRWLHHSVALKYMKEIGELAQKHPVVLVCYEKDAKHCHRTLLAQTVAKWSGCEYKGELPGAVGENP